MNIEKTPNHLTHIVRNLIAEGKTIEAIDALLEDTQLDDEMTEDLIMMRNRLLTAEAQFAAKEINYEKLIVTTNQIAEYILSYFTEIKSRITPPIVPTTTITFEPKTTTIRFQPQPQTVLEQNKVKKSIVIQFISNGETEQLLTFLSDAAYPQSIIYQSSYNAIRRRLLMGCLLYEDWYTFQKELFEDIVTWDYINDIATPDALTDSEKSFIQILLDQDQTFEALPYCKDRGDTFAILCGYFTLITNDYKRTDSLLFDTEYKKLEDLTQKAILSLINTPDAPPQ